MKTRRIPSAIPIYLGAAAFAICGLVFPLYKLGYILLSAVVGLGVYFLGSKIFRGREMPVETPVDTGDSEVDRQIREGLAELAKLEQAAQQIPSAEVKIQLERMVRAGRQIFDAVVQTPEKSTQVRKFMNYYLPTCVKLLDQYRYFSKLNARGGHVEGSIQSIQNSLDMIASAFEKQLDNLFRAEAMDISSDIDVLETMMAAEGLTGQPNFQTTASMSQEERAARLKMEAERRRAASTAARETPKQPIELKLPEKEQNK